MPKIARGAIVCSTALVLCLVTPPAKSVPQFEDVAQQTGIFEVNTTSLAAPADYDTDGDTDVLIGFHTRGAKLWRNDGSTFTRVAADAWQRGDRHDCTWGDANADGRPDAYCTLGRTKSSLVKSDAKDNELWLQQADGTFIDRGTEWGVGDPYGRGRATTFLDANGDPFPDLFIGNALPRASDPDGGLNGENKLFINQSGQGLTAAPGFGLHQFEGSDCAEAVDYNLDGWEDLFVCGTKRSLLYRNDSGQGFTEVASSSGIITTVRRDADFGDLDGDGDPDAVSISSKNVKYQLLQGGAFGPARIITSLTDGAATALGDADGDGELDVYALQRGRSSSNPTDYLLLNSALTFVALAAPEAGGRGDTVEPLDYDSNGKTDFVVLNGFTLNVTGPVQLITWSGG